MKHDAGKSGNPFVTPFVFWSLYRDRDRNATHDIVQLEVSLRTAGMAIVAFDTGIRYGAVGIDGLEVVFLPAVNDAGNGSLRRTIQLFKGLPFEVRRGRVALIDWEQSDQTIPDTLPTLGD